MASRSVGRPAKRPAKPQLTSQSSRIRRVARLPLCVCARVAWRPSASNYLAGSRLAPAARREPATTSGRRSIGARDLICPGSFAGRQCGNVFAEVAGYLAATRLAKMIGLARALVRSVGAGRKQPRAALGRLNKDKPRATELNTARQPTQTRARAHGAERSH